MELISKPVGCVSSFEVDHDDTPIDALYEVEKFARAVEKVRDNSAFSEGQKISICRMLAADFDLAIVSALKAGTSRRK